MNLSIQKLSAHIGPHCILDNINLNLDAGSHLSIMGHSGSGKSSLIRIILGLKTKLSISGRICFSNLTIQLNNQRIVPIAKQGYAYVPQSLSLWPHINVAKTLRLTQNFAHSDFEVDELLSIFGLISHKKSFPHELSAGEQQRLALARALIAKPKLLILDEAFSNLDTVSKYSLLKILKKKQKDLGFTSIFVTHDFSEASFWGQNLMILYQGKSLWTGSLEKFRIDPPQWPLLQSHHKLNRYARSQKHVCIF
ncbi:MAG: ATP-binding cassette domain-containing protein [Myxococcales bacterium]|nr:MAG: ATP-binding cassette domain-containing protein [Myxococcales bacterium]